MAADPTDAKKAAEILKKAMAEWSDPEVHKQLQEYEDILERFPEKADMVAKAVGRINKEMREAADASRSLERGTERLIRSLTGVEKSADGVAAGFARMVDEADKGKKIEAMGKALRTMGKEMAATITPTNVGIAVYKKFAEASIALTLEVDNATSAFAKATGTGNQYKNVIKAAEFQNRQYGVSATEASAATTALLGGFSEFLTMDADLQPALVGEIAQFEKFGVAASTSAKFLENVTRTTSRSIPETQRLQKSIMTTANAFGDDLNKVMEESSEIMPKLAIHGKDLEGVFNNLYSASKRTGMGMGEIVSFAERFDTFEDAAQAAGNLNAVLGQMGGAPIVDTMQILEETDPAKRMQLFSDAIQQSVGDFEELGYYQQKAIANTMGMSVEETRRILLQEEQTNKLTAAMQKANLEPEEWNALMTDGQDLMSKMKILAMQFAMSLQGPLDAVKTIVGGLSDGLAALDEWKKKTADAMGEGSVLGKSLAALGGLAKLGLGLMGTAGLLRVMLAIAAKGLTPLTAIYTRASDLAAAAAPGATGALKSVAKIALPLAGLAVAVAGVSHAIKTVGKEEDEEKKKRRSAGAYIGGAAAGGLGIWGGMAAGAAMGSVVPGLGTVIGGITGGLAGLGLGATAGSTIGGFQHGGFNLAGRSIEPMQAQNPTTLPVGSDFANVAEKQASSEAIIPLNEQGRKGIGMTDNNKLLAAINEQLDKFIGTVARHLPGADAEGVVPLHSQGSAGVGPSTPNVVVPLNQKGREEIGMTDNNKLLEANNKKLDELITAVSNQRPVLIKSDLERAGFLHRAMSIVK